MVKSAACTQGAVGGLTLVNLRKGLSVDEAVESYAKRPDVKYVSRNYIRGTAAGPNDPYFLNGSLWGSQNNGQGGGTPGGRYRRYPGVGHHDRKPRCRDRRDRQRDRLQPCGSCGQYVAQCRRLL